MQKISALQVFSQLEAVTKRVEQTIKMRDQGLITHDHLYLELDLASKAVRTIFDEGMAKVIGQIEAAMDKSWNSAEDQSRAEDSLAAQINADCRVLESEHDAKDPE